MKARSRALPGAMRLALATAVATAACDPSPASPGPDRPAWTIAEASSESESQFEGKTDMAWFSGSWAIPDGIRIVGLTIWRGDFVLDPDEGIVFEDTTYLSYLVFDCTGTPRTCRAVEEGAGLIGNTDVSGSGTRRLVLSTDTGADANPTFDRWAGDGGPIEITWERNDAVTYRRRGTSTFELGDFRQAVSGAFTSSLATVTGTISGVPIDVSAVIGEMSANAGATVRVVRGP